MSDDINPHDIMTAALRRLHDVSDVLAAVCAAARLLGEQVDKIELEILELARLASDKPKN